MSLAVKDLEASRQFYQALGFEQFGGGTDMNYLMLKNGDAIIGLFQGMFEGNILTFNPGWDANAEELPEYTDVRELQRRLKDQGLVLDAEADEDSSGPASIMLTDPDGNAILLDQHR